MKAEFEEELSKLGLGFCGLGNNQLKEKLMRFASLDVGLLSENQ